jgi:hypothetical protein
MTQQTCYLLGLTFSPCSYIAAYDIDLDPPYLTEPKADGPIKRGTPHDSLAVFGPLIRGGENVVPSANPTPTRLLLNGALTPDEAAQLIAAGTIDGAVFGIPWITNPDLYRRIVGRKPLSDKLNFYGLYNWDGDNIGEGYNDYPIAA